MGKKYKYNNMQKIGTRNFQQTSMGNMQKNLQIGSNEGNTKQ